MKESKKKKLRLFHAEVSSTIKNKRLVMTVYFLLRLSVIFVLIAQAFNRNFENVFLCVLTLILFTLPTVLERRLKIDIPNTLEVIILLFIYAAEILGEIQSFYLYIPNWDTMLHTMNGFLCAAIGFSLLDILNRNEKVKFSLSPLYLAIVAFCFSMTVGVLWEFFEAGMDRFFLLDMQKDSIIHNFGSVMLDPTNSNRPVIFQDIVDVIVVQGDGTQTALGLGGYLDTGLWDTMEDLFVNFIGAVAFSIIGYFYVRSRGRGRFASRFIPVIVPDEAAPPESGKESPSPDEPAPSGEI
ncbi:MAG TPA: hypothetical protein H9915_07745 [Candidatus Gemmiger faecigallinarum]|nr:hypothetical protein [Candidatus Gemmiger faecigallinarum]